MKKKIFLTIAIMVVLTCLFALCVFAAEPSYNDGEWIYAADGTTKLAIRDTDGNPLLWYMNGEELKYVRADQTDETQDVYVKYSISSGGSGFDKNTFSPEKTLKTITVYDNGTEIIGSGSNLAAQKIVLINMERLDIDALNGWLFGNKNGCCPLLRGIVLPSTLKGIGQEGFTNTKLVQVWNLENTQLFYMNASDPFATTTLTQEATNGVLRCPETMLRPISAQYSNITTYIMNPNFDYPNLNQPWHQYFRGCKSLQTIYCPAQINCGFGDEAFRDTPTQYIIFITGSKQDAENMLANSGTAHNSGYLASKIISYDDYLLDKETYDSSTKQAYVVYGYNYCDAFYDGNHDIVSDNPENKCCGICQREECAKFAINVNAEHKESLKAVFGEEKTESVDFYADMYVLHVCEFCNTEVGEDEKYTSIFTSVGYSASETDKTSITFETIVNHDVLSKYEEVAKSEVQYGFVISAAPSASPITGVDENGEVKVGTGTIKVNMTNGIYNRISVVVRNLSEGKTLNCCGYVVDAKRVTYLGHASSNAEAEIIDHSGVIELTK